MHISIVEDLIDLFSKQMRSRPDNLLRYPITIERLKGSRVVAASKTDIQLCQLGIELKKKKNEGNRRGL